MSNNFDLASLALQAVCPGNELLYDDRGMPSVMVKVPKQTYAQLGLGTSTNTHPAWIVNSVEVDAIHISKFHNIVENGRAYSLPGRDPRASITADAAMAACVAKGEGWHLMTRLEMAAIACWCLRNGTLPFGNNNYGKDHREANFKAIPTSFEADGRTARVATGTGPLSWSHDRTPSGIFDLNGNIWDWNGGFRLVFGELQVLIKGGNSLSNDAADSINSQNETSSLWMAINGTNGSLITPNGLGTTANSLKLDFVSNVWAWITGAITSRTTDQRACAFRDMTATGINANALLMLQALGLFKGDGAHETDRFYAVNGEAERWPLSGGSWHGGTNAGVFASTLSNPRSHSHSSFGFRAAFVKLPPA